MPIPTLTSDGLLPAGVHPADLPEIKLTFGSGNARRATLFESLTQLVGLAQSFTLFKAIFIDGSFVTDKDDPGDIDAVLELPRADLAKLLAHPNKAALVDAAAVKVKYEVDLFFQPLPPVAPQPDMAGFFQRLKPGDAIIRKLPPDTKRGILKVIL